MRISSHSHRHERDRSRSCRRRRLPRAGAVAVTAASAPAPALAFDGTTSPATASLSPSDGLRAGAHAPEAGAKPSALTALQYAAEQGEPVAQWKLGRMYADGDGVPRDELRAFNYFSQIANTHPDEVPGTPQARFVANAFVALGHYYLNGIPNSQIEPDPDRAREMFGLCRHLFRRRRRAI